MSVTALASVDFDKIILLGIEEVWGFDRDSGEVLFAFDQIKSGELSGTHDTTYAEGKRGVRLATLKSNKTSSFSCENGYVIFSGLAGQLGAEVKTASSESKITVIRAENIATTDESGTLKLSGTPSGDSLKLYSCNSDKTKKALLKMGETETDDYTIKDDVITLKASVKKDTVYLATYNEEVTIAKRIVNDGESFSKDVRLVINMMGQDLCSSNTYLVQCIMPKASISGEWNLSLGTDPAVHNFSAEASLDVCTLEKELCEFIVC